LIFNDGEGDVVHWWIWLGWRTWDD